jgi:hypothetical protein
MRIRGFVVVVIVVVVVLVVEVANVVIFPSYAPL